MHAFVEGSATFNYLTVVTKMRENRQPVAKLTEADKETFNKVVKSGGYMSRALRAMNDLYEFDDAYKHGSAEQWQKKLTEIRYSQFSGLDLHPSKPYFA